MRLRFGWHSQGAWRLEWKRPFEYWYRSLLGPIYVLHYRPASDFDYLDELDDEDDE